MGRIVYYATREVKSWPVHPLKSNKWKFTSYKWIFTYLKWISLVRIQRAEYVEIVTWVRRGWQTCPQTRVRCFQYSSLSRAPSTPLTPTRAETLTLTRNSLFSHLVAYFTIYNSTLQHKCMNTRIVWVRESPTSCTCIIMYYFSINNWKILIYNQITIYRSLDTYITIQIFFLIFIIIIPEL